MTAPDIYIGLMSGTSVDSVDAAAVSFGQDNLRLLGTHSHDIPATLKKAILGLSEPGIDDVLLYSQTDNEIGELFAQATLALMSKLNITAVIFSFDMSARVACANNSPISLSV